MEQLNGSRFWKRYSIPRILPKPELQLGHFQPCNTICVPIKAVSFQRVVPTAFGKSCINQDIAGKTVEVGVKRAVPNGNAKVE